MVKKDYLFFGIALLVILLDQLTKYLISIFQPVWNLPLLTIHLVKNTGAGFGLLQNFSFWLGILSLIIFLIIIIFRNKIPSQTAPQLLFAFFLGGVAGNMLDRFFRGFVVDFLDFHFWPAFNLADACLTVSVIGIVIYFWRE